MKGCVRGYGNYEELTSSGVDPTELFNDIEDNSIKSPNLVQPDIVAEECNDEIESDQLDIKSPDHIHLLPIEKARRHVRLRHSESNDYNFDPVFGEGSVYTSPSLFSLVSIPEKDEDNKVIKDYF